MKAEIFKDLPPWSKGVIAIAVVAALAFTGIAIYRKVKADSTSKSNKDLIKNATDEIAQLRKQYVPTYADSQYNQFSNTIYEGMRQCVGDDYGTVQDTLQKMKNDLDVALLIKTFGVRQNYCFGVEVGTPMDLFTFVNKELGSDYLGLTKYRINDINADFLKKGITYQL